MYTYTRDIAKNQFFACDNNALSVVPAKFSKNLPIYYTRTFETHMYNYIYIYIAVVKPHTSL